MVVTCVRTRLAGPLLLQLQLALWQERLCWPMEEEMMIAPGTGGLEQVPRAVFERNPGDYFRELRRK
ncbi:unnamed protein product [Prunus armeniaca]